MSTLPLGADDAVDGVANIVSPSAIERSLTETSGGSVARSGMLSARFVFVARFRFM